MTKVRLTKLASNHTNLRTDVVEGETPTWPPIEGSVFVLVGPPLEYGDVRILTTSPVKSFVEITDKTFEIKTQNSTYRLEAL